MATSTDTIMSIVISLYKNRLTINKEKKQGIQQISSAISGIDLSEKKTKRITFILLLFLGVFGAHHFYLKKPLKGIAYIIYHINNYYFGYYRFLCFCSHDRLCF